VFEPEQLAYVATSILQQLSSAHDGAYAIMNTDMARKILTDMREDQGHSEIPGELDGGYVEAKLSSLQQLLDRSICAMQV
jgi:hypothetical protein